MAAIKWHTADSFIKGQLSLWADLALTMKWHTAGSFRPRSRGKCTAVSKPAR
jgi:hypothetical protein